MTPQQIWQSQATEAPRISLEYVRNNVRALERRTRGRNSLEYGSCVLAIVLSAWAGWQHFTTKPIMLAALAWFALWSLYYLYIWRRYAAVESVPEEEGVLDTLRYQRRQLVRQRDARAHYWRRFGPTLLPGCALMLAAMTREFSPVPWGSIGFMVGWLVVSLGGITWFVKYEARRFQRDIDALDSLAEGK